MLDISGNDISDAKELFQPSVLFPMACPQCVGLMLALVNQRFIDAGNNSFFLQYAKSNPNVVHGGLGIWVTECSFLCLFIEQHGASGDILECSAKREIL